MFADTDDDYPAGGILALWDVKHKNCIHRMRTHARATLPHFHQMVNSLPVDLRTVKYTYKLRCRIRTDDPLPTSF